MAVDGNRNLTLGCIGCGNMGGAMLRGWAARSNWNLLGHDHSRAKVEAVCPDSPERARWADSPEELAREADIVILAVKPAQMPAMLSRVAPSLNGDKLLISVAAAFPLNRLEEGVQRRCPVIRVMPNLPALAGKGVFAVCLDHPALRPEQKNLVLDLFRRLGMAVPLPEERFPAFTALAGCGPAFVCLFMEGMLNAAVTMGFSARDAAALVAATVEGTARLALDSGGDFAGLRLRVCSPAGTTIYGVNHLERQAVRAHVADAVLAAEQRDHDMSAALNRA